MIGRCLVLALLGVIGVGSLAAAPLEALMPDRLAMSPMVFRFVALIQPLILVLAATALGCWLAYRVGLDAPVVRAVVARKGLGAALRPQLLPVALVGAGAAAILIGYGWLSAGWVADTRLAQGFEIPLVSRLLYGGIAEELMTRWGLMSLFAWGLWRIGGAGAPVPGWVFWGAAGAAATVFALGHLPTLFMAIDQPPGAMIVAVIIGNMVPGLAFGILFWRRGLEAAMIAHAAAHLLAEVATKWL